MKRSKFINNPHNGGQFRIEKFASFLYLFILLGCSQLSISQNSTAEFKTANDTLIVYKDVPGLVPSDKYAIRVRSAASNNEWVDCFAHYTRNKASELPDDGVDKATTNYHYQLFTDKWSHTYGNFEMNKGSIVEIEISLINGFKVQGNDLQKVVAHPAHRVLDQPQIRDGKIYFTMNNPGQIVIDINGQMDDFNKALDDTSPTKSYVTHAISIFANPVQKKPSLTDPRVHIVEVGAIPTTDPSTYDILYFKPGVHDIGQGFKVHPGKKYYIPGDALVYGSFNNYGVPTSTYRTNGQDIKLYGLGTVSGERILHPNYVVPYNPDHTDYKTFFIENGLNVEINGVTIIDPANHSVNFNAWGGRDKMQEVTFARWVKIVTWRANGDGIGSSHLIEDCFFRTADDASYIKGNRRRIVFWKDANAAMFHMAGIPDAGDNFPIIIEDCDVIYNRTRGVSGGGVFVQRSEGDPLQRFVDVTVRNFRVSDPRSNMPTFYLTSTKVEAGVQYYGSSYSGLKFQNVTVAKPIYGGRKNQITGASSVPWNGGVCFDNVNLAGELLTETVYERDFTKNEFVTNICFKNSQNYTLTINNSSGGTITPDSNLGVFVSGTKVKLTAVPQPGYEFKGWISDASGLINPLEVTMDSNKTISALFEKSSSFTFETPGSGTWTVPSGVTSIILKSWGGGGAGGSAYSGTATLNTQVRGGGGAGGSFAGTTIAVTPGQVINFTIGAGGQSSMEGFTDSSVGQSGGATIASLNSVTLVEAVGGAAGVNRSGTNVVIGGNGGTSTQSGNTGTILFYGGNGGTGGAGGAGGGGGSAGEQGNGGSTTSYIAGAAGAGGGVAGEAGLNTTAPGSNGKIPGGGGAGGAVRNPSPFASNNITKIGGSGGNGKLMIIIPEIRYTLATSSNPLHGSVTVNPVQETYAENSSVTLTAIANAGYTFLNWSGAVSGTTNPISIIMDNNKNVVANFVAIQYQVSLSVNGGIGGTVSGGGTFNQGQSITVLATPSAGYSFVHWTENDIPVSTNASYTFNVDQARVLMAQFQVIAPNQTPYLGTAATIPGIIEAEKYDEGGQGIAYNDDATKQGNTSYRPADMVDVVSKSTASNGYVAGFSNTGEWLEYTVNVTPGTYDLKLNYFCNSTTAGDLKVSLDGVLLTTITEIVSQGSTTIQGTVTVPNLTVAGGSGKVLRLEYVGSKFDIDAIQFSACSDNLPWSTPNVKVTKATLNKTYPVVNTSCASSVSISVDIEGIGSLESSDYCRVYYRIDGGALQTLVNKTGAFAKQTFTVTGLNANSIEIVINAKASASDETYNLSNIKVFQTGSQVARIANTNKNGNTNLNKEIKIYPNPVSSFLNINFSNAGTSKEIKIFNLLGQMVHTTTTENSEVQIDMQSLNLKGVVIVQVKEEDVVSNFKVIVK